MTDYIETGFDINARNPQINPTKPFLSLTGSSIIDATNPEFYKVYNTSDLLKFFEINENTTDNTVIDRVTMRCKSMIKFLPYDGFYPVQRTVQLANLFSASYLGSIPFNQSSDTIVNRSSGSARAGLTPFFGPGIMYNSIKAGIAVDFAMPADNTYLTGTLNIAPNDKFYVVSNSENQDFVRIPFEAIIDPNSKLGDDEEWFDLFLDNKHNTGQTHTGHVSFTGAKYEFQPSLGVNPLLYTLASNNFFAETINFFLPEGNMTRITSLPSSHPEFANNSNQIIKASSDTGANFQTYEMEIVISDSPNFAGGTTQFSNYNDPKAYGPGVARNNTGAAINYSMLAPLYKHPTARPTDTNPNLAGLSKLTLAYTPKNPDDPASFTMDEILNNLTSSFIPTNANFEGAINYAQHFTSSFNIGKARILETDFDAITGQPTTVKKDSSQIDVMFIEPKWECPMLNFRDVTATTVPSSGVTNRIGMWHQYGQIDENNGVYIKVRDAALADTNITGSLADLLGFDKTGGKTKKRLGRVASTKEISEAVVAIPFRVIGGNKTTFKISRKVINQAEKALDGIQLTPQEAMETDQSIIDMVEKMRRFVIPPHMDFMTYGPSLQQNSAGDKALLEQIPGGPFAMYIFEFKHILTQQDLANIWQNLPPVSIGGSPFYHDSDEVTISHEVFNTMQLNLINGQKSLNDGTKQLRSDLYTDDIQWMVFKVKKRATANYFEKTTNLNDGGQFQFKFANQEEFPNITYNWPYDFFSMVELVKLDAEITMTPLADDGKVDISQSEEKEFLGTKIVNAANLNEGAPLPAGTTTPTSLAPTQNNSFLGGLQAPLITTDGGSN